MSDPRLLRASIHECAHVCARELLPTLTGIQFVALTLDDVHGSILGNVRCNPEQPTETVFNNVVAKFAGHAAEVLLLNVNEAHALEAARDDHEQIERLIAKFSEDDRQYFRVRGMRAARSFVCKHADTIRKLARELRKHHRLDGDRVREIVERPR
jgi:hypothetical protein